MFVARTFSENRVVWLYVNDLSMSPHAFSRYVIIAALAHARLFDTVRLALDGGEPETAYALTTRVLRRSQEGTLPFPYSPSELERLRGLAAEASLESPALTLKSQ